MAKIRLIKGTSEGNEVVSEYESDAVPRKSECILLKKDIHDTQEFGIMYVRDVNHVIDPYGLAHIAILLSKEPV